MDNEITETFVFKWNSFEQEFPLGMMRRCNFSNGSTFSMLVFCNVRSLFWITETSCSQEGNAKEDLD